MSKVQPDPEPLLRLLPAFEQPGYSFGEWVQREDEFPFVDYSPEVSRFVQAFYDAGWALPSFDWPDWQEEAQRYWSDPALVAKAASPILRQLLMTHIRKDRFCEGHLLEAFQSGHITAILRRLKELAQTEAHRVRPRVRNRHGHPRVAD